MKTIFTAFILACSLFAFAQEDARSIDLDGAVAVHIYAAFSSVSVTTGGTDALSVDHTFNVEEADRPDLRKLTVERINGIIHLREIRPTARLLKAEFPTPKGSMLTGAREGGKGVFNNVMIDATLKVVVPAGVKVTVKTEYGGIEAVNVGGLVEARAKYGDVEAIFTTTSPRSDLDLYSNYGAVDLTVPFGSGFNLDLTTEYGELLTDIEINVDPEASTEKEFYQQVIGSVNGGGGKVTCKTPYGNVYLRMGSK